MSKSSAVPSGVTAATLAKDLRLEWRSKDALNSMLFFSLLVVVVFSFSFDPNAEESRQIAGGRDRPIFSDVHSARSQRD